MTLLSCESDNLSTMIIPTIDLASSVFRPSYDGIMNKACFLIKASDGLDPVFRGDFSYWVVVQECNVLYFEDHYHSYATELLPAKSVESLHDYTLLHGH